MALVPFKNLLRFLQKKCGKHLNIGKKDLSWAAKFVSYNGINYLGVCFVDPSSPSVKTPLLCSGPSPVCQRCPVFDHCIAPKVQCHSLHLRGPSLNWRGPKVGCRICAVSLDCTTDTASCGRGIYERDHRCGHRICSVLLI